MNKSRKASFGLAGVRLAQPLTFMRLSRQSAAGVNADRLLILRTALSIQCSRSPEPSGWLSGL